MANFSIGILSVFAYRHLENGLAGMRKEAPLNQETLEAISKVLGNTEFGLTGSEIDHVLRTCKIQNTDPKATKWKRLYNAFVAEQNRKQYSNHVVGFIHHAMKPVRWSGKREEFEHLRDELNKVIAFAGLTLLENGELKRSNATDTLSEAEQRADTLRGKLVQRDVHPDVLVFCRAELLSNNYFHAVLEACKSVANKIRIKSDLTSDGAELATGAFSLGRSGVPVLAINALSTDTERGEQRGFANLLVGLFGTFRNPTAHGEKIYWPVSEQDALDILSLVSLVHRKLDGAVKT